MFDVSKLFGKGDKNTLLMKNGLNFSYNGPYATVVEGLILDRFHVGTFCSAEYTISIDYDTNNKEIIRALVVGSPSNSSVTIYGRSNLGNDLFIKPSISSIELITSKSFFLSDITCFPS